MISIAITSFNRSGLTIESFSKVFDHPLLSEIVIIDDFSTEEHWDRLLRLIDAHPATQKINLFRNEKNLGMSLNKREAVSRAKNQWVVLLDSDNILYPEYLDELLDLQVTYGLNQNIIYCPGIAEPDYDFNSLPRNIDGGNAKSLLHKKEFRVLLNCCNYVVNREKYLKVYKYDETIRESDTIYFNYLWLEAGNSFHIVPGMRYYHLRHPGSGWLQGDHSYNIRKAEELQEKIKNL